ncbi:agmatine deiminase family protein [Pseudomaricurvus alkylphenolicus]|uniref:agmatine deiminase family protein n=1 Tax=Pseudomaricurvus alkylphenolicus TaxID=1306991 RepID=UPI001F0E7361|nr:agmatine deiminase family protein [Pseudomaricurvus alkylphenolicus]
MSNTNSQSLMSPADEGFRMPAEWEAHDRCWMMWPSRESMWEDFDKTKSCFAGIAQAISEFEPVTVVVCEQDAQEARSLMGEDIDLMVAPIDDSWARDAGPNFLVNERGELAGSCWEFNAWGQKYQPHHNDNAVGEVILKHAGARSFVSELVAEGGAISVDGEGTVLTTESCLLHTNRNPGWSRRQVEEELCRTLGATKVIWLPGNDDEVETNGHVDGLAAFVRPGVVLMEISYDPEHPWYDIMRANLEALKGQTDAKGRTIDIVLIEDAYGCEMLSDSFCTSYINSYLPNGGVVMPKYGIAADERARAVFEKLFPERRIVQVNVDGVAVGGGGIHCITQQQPRP